MSLLLSLIAVALLAVQLGLALEPRRANPLRPAEPVKGSPVRMTDDVG